MEAVEAIYTQFAALVNADTGSGGLRNSTGNQYIRGGVFRETDIKDKGTVGRPYLSVAVNGIEEGHEASGRAFSGVIRARIGDDRDGGVTKQDAVLAGLVVLCNGVALASGSTGWTFSTMTFLRVVQQVGGKEIGPIAEFQVYGTK